MTLSEFQARLAELGLTLSPAALAAAWAGAQHLRGEVARIDTYLKQSE